MLNNMHRINSMIAYQKIGAVPGADKTANIDKTKDITSRTLLVRFNGVDAASRVKFEHTLLQMVQDRELKDRIYIVTDKARQEAVAEQEKGLTGLFKGKPQDIIGQMKGAQYATLPHPGQRFL